MSRVTIENEMVGRSADSARISWRFLRRASSNKTVKVFPDIIGAKAPNAGVKLVSYKNQGQ